MNLLLVEDNKADAYLLMECFEQQGEVPKVDWVHDGSAAIDYVSQRGDYTAAARPDVILLDLGLPRISGYEALKQLRANPDYRSIPVVILTTSCNPLDARQCMDLGASAFFSKPRNLQGYEALARQLVRDELPRLAKRARA